MKKILIACDSFKGSLGSKEIADIFAEVGSTLNCDIDVRGVEIADGGEGTLDAILACGKLNVRKTRCLNPLFKEIEARYAYRDGIAVVETAECSGLTLIDFCKGNASITTTYGTGEVMRQAILDGAKEIYVSVGGSATNDGGIGALSALGYEFLDSNGNRITPIGKNLKRISDVKKASDITDGIKFTVIADVDNPLLGANGATMVYGRQKGATESELAELELGMENYARITQKVTGIDISNMRGAGAAGGLAGGLIAYLGADIKSGIESVFNIIDFESEVANADAIITGEGCIDAQSLHGKAVYGVCTTARRHNVPVYAVAGGSALDDNDLKKLGIIKLVTLTSYALSLDDSMLNARRYAYRAAENLLRSITENS